MKNGVTFGCHLVTPFVQRRERDSNPWTTNVVNGFRDRPDRPLRHLSFTGSGKIKATCESLGGDRGIRTPEAFRLNGFQDRRYRPLSHISAAKVQKLSIKQVFCEKKTFLPLF